LKVQEDLKPDEVLLEYVLDDPNFLLRRDISPRRLRETAPDRAQGDRELAQQYVDEIRTKASGAELSNNSTNDARETDSRNFQR
jgi:hypothetical protein